jgi:hypothetical protein
MKKIPNAERFPFHIKQVDDNSCIPASIEAVTKHFVPTSTVTQAYLWRQFSSACTRKNVGLGTLSFKLIKELVIDTDPCYSWAESRHIDRPSSFEELTSLVRGSIDNELPHMVSVPVQGGRWHILTAIGYDDVNLLVHDPDRTKASPYEQPLTKLHSDLKTLAKTDVTDSLVLGPKGRFSRT